MSFSIPVIIADNQPLTSAGIRVFAQQTLVTVRFLEAHTKQDLIRLLEAEPEAIVVLDYTGFDFNGIEDFLIIHNRFGAVRWLLCSYMLSEQFIRRVAAEDNIGIVLKECSADELRRALLATSHSEQFLCRQVSTLLATAQKTQQISDTLTPTEIEILKLIAQGNSVKDIAAKRVSSVHTIITHKKNIFLKLGINNVHEATKYALRAGLVELMEYYI